MASLGHGEEIEPGTGRSRLSTFEQPYSYSVPPDARSRPTAPPRTFTHDQFLSAHHRAKKHPNDAKPTMVLCHPKPVPKNVLRNQTASAKLPRPTSKPPLPPMSDSAIGLPTETPPIETTSCAAGAEAEDDAVYDVADRNRPKKKTKFAMSHDYEEVTGTCKLYASMRRAASDELIYAKPYRSERIESLCSQRGSDTPPRIYYASSTVVKQELSPHSNLIGGPFARNSKLLGSSARLFDKFKGRLTQSSANLNRTQSLKKRKYLDNVTLAVKARNSHIISSGVCSSNRPVSLNVSCSDSSYFTNDSSGSNSSQTSPVDLSTSATEATLAPPPRVLSRFSSVDSSTNRSLILRRTTIMYHENEIAFRKRRAPQLFELFAFVGLDLTEHCEARGTYIPPERSNYIPVIKYSYPRKVYRKGSDEADILSNLPFLTFPDYTTVTPIETMQEYYFVVTLTDMCGTRRCAYCCRYLPVDSEDPSRAVLPAVLVLVSPVHASYFYQELLREAVSRLKVNLQLCINFLKSAFHKPYPQKGSCLTISTGIAGDIVLLNDSAHERVIADTYRTMEILDVRNLLTVFSALLSEKRILIIAGDIETLSTCIQGLTSLLYPFKWPHTLIPVVPDCNIELCFAPFPYLMGVLRTNQTNLAKLKQLFKSEEEEFLLILDVDMGIIRNEDIEGLNRNLPNRIQTGLQSVLSSLMNDWLPAANADAAVYQTRSLFLSYFSNEDIEGLNRNLPNRIQTGLQSVLSSLMNDWLPAANADAAVYREGDELLSELFLLVFVELVGHYRKYTVRQQDGSALLLVDKFIEGHKSKSVQTFLQWFTQMGMFQVWRRQKLDDIENEDLFDEKVREVRKIFHGRQTWLKQITSRFKDPFRIM